MFLSILGVDLVYPACPMVRSAKHGELFLSQGEKMVEKCEGLARFEQKETGKMFCLRKKGKVPEKLACATCECGQENKPSAADPRVVGGENVGENEHPWYALIFKHDKDNATVAGKMFTLISNECIYLVLGYTGYKIFSSFSPCIRQN